MGVKKLFLVDDDDIFRVASEVLVKYNNLAEEVISFENGLLAFEALMALEHSPDELPELLFLDINMPIMNGWEFLEEIKEGPEIIRNTVKIHILTSSIDPNDLVLSKSYDFISGYIAKPLTDSDINKVAQSLSSATI